MPLTWWYKLRESCMLFVVFRLSKTPVPSDRSSHIWAHGKALMQMALSVLSVDFIQFVGGLRISLVTLRQSLKKICESRKTLGFFKIIFLFFNLG
jgi:hypothetical protein